MKGKIGRRMRMKGKRRKRRRMKGKIREKMEVHVGEIKVKSGK